MCVLTAGKALRGEEPGNLGYLIFIQVCDRCRQKTRSTKKLTVQRFPRILVLRILIFKSCFFHPLFFSLPTFAKAGYLGTEFPLGTLRPPYKLLVPLGRGVDCIPDLSPL